jgi:hypothetical protein
MIPKAEFFEWIENYCLEQLTKDEILEFELELQNNNELQDEFKFHKDIQSAITEIDVLSLKQKLEEIAKEQKIGKKENGTFELLNDFSNIEEINENVSPEDLINFYDSLPKVHVYQHKLVSNENIHEFYREQNQSQLNEDEDSLAEDFDFIDMKGLEEAILEKDILNLRDTLSQVAKSVKPQFSTEDIENYLSGELSGEMFDNFEIELEQNSSLKQELDLFMDLDNALQETDIINLRSKISQIIETETSWNVTEQNIEKFIDGELESELLEEFLAELNENTDLMTEVSLRKNVNEAIGENDIFSLRERLVSARKSAENNEMKSIIPATATKLTSNWKKYAAVAVILIGISSTLKFGLNNSDRTYNSFYNSPEWAPERSVTSDVNILSEANSYYINGNYQKAIDLYDVAITSESEKYVFHFYKGASLQNMNKFDEAIPEYNQVISHGNNLFIEEAEWNKSLCYVKLGEIEKANEQLNAIINKNGFYKKDAKAVLRKIKYSLK